MLRSDGLANALAAACLAPGSAGDAPLLLGIKALSLLGTARLGPGAVRVTAPELDVCVAAGGPPPCRLLSRRVSTHRPAPRAPARRRGRRAKALAPQLAGDGALLDTLLTPEVDIPVVPGLLLDAELPLLLDGAVPASANEPAAAKRSLDDYDVADSFFGAVVNEWCDNKLTKLTWLDEGPRAEAPAALLEGALVPKLVEAPAALLEEALVPKLVDSAHR